MEPIDTTMIQIMLNDKGRAYEEAERYFHAAGAWADENCQSFQGWNLADVSDTSMTNDLLAWYDFQDDQDAVIFKLRWT